MTVRFRDDRSAASDGSLGSSSAGQLLATKGSGAS